ncbi:hypothetical protein ES703_99009 [subsurface metagenome]
MTEKEAKAVIADEAAKPIEMETADKPLDEADDKVVEEAVVEQTQEQTDKETTEAKAAPVEAPAVTGEQAAEHIASGIAQPVDPAKSDKIWSPGMPVNVIQEDELKMGNIVGIHPPGPGSGALQLTVQFGDGTTVTVNEDEVEAV